MVVGPVGVVVRMSAATYRAVHGLSPGTALVAAGTAQAMRAGWARHAGAHLADLDEHRDPGRARAASTPATQRSPQQRAQRQEVARARRRELTAAQHAELGDDHDLVAWCARVRALVARDGVSLAAVGRAYGLGPPTVSLRLRRHPDLHGQAGRRRPAGGVRKLLREADRQVAHLARTSPMPARTQVTIHRRQGRGCSARSVHRG